MSSLAGETGPSPEARRSPLVGEASFVLASRVVSVATLAAVNVLAVRLLDTRGAATFLLSMSLVTGLAVATQAGLNQTVVRLIAGSLARGLPGRAREAIIQTLVVTMVIVTLVVVPSITPLAKDLGRWLFTSSDVGSLMGLVGGLVAVRTIGLIRSEIFRGFGEIRLASVFNTTDANLLGAVALGGAWLAGFRPTNAGPVLALLMLAWVPGIGFAAWMIRRRTQRLVGPGRLQVTELLQVTWPVVMSAISVYGLVRIPLWIVGATAGSADVARFGVAVLVMDLLATPLVVVNAVIPHRIAARHASGGGAVLERLLRSTATLAAVVTLCGYGAIALIGRPVLEWIFGGYEGAWTLALILGAGQVANVWVGSCGLSLVMCGYERSMMWVSVLSVATTASIALVGSVTMGVLGAAIGATLGTALQNALMWMAARRHLGVRTDANMRLLPAAVKFTRELHPQ